VLFPESTQAKAAGLAQTRKDTGYSHFTVSQN